MPYTCIKSLIWVQQGTFIAYHTPLPLCHQLSNECKKVTTALKLRNLVVMATSTGLDLESDHRYRLFLLFNCPDWQLVMWYAWIEMGNNVPKSTAWVNLASIHTILAKWRKLSTSLLLFTTATDIRWHLSLERNYIWTTDIMTDILSCFSWEGFLHILLICFSFLFAVDNSSILYFLS